MMRILAAAIPGGLTLLVASSAFAQSDVPTVVTEPSPAPAANTVVVQPAAVAQPAVVAQPTTLESANDRQNGGQGLEWVYLNADVGAAFTNMASLRASNWNLQDTSSSGPAFGIAAGVRLLFLSLGLRVRDLEPSSFNMWEINAEAAVHMRIWHIDPYFGVRGGYAILGALSPQAIETSTGTAASDVTVHGWNVGPMVGIDVYFSKLISVGFDANAEVLFLRRPALPLAAGQTVAPQYRALYADSGSSVGAGVVTMAHMGVHF